MASKRKQPKTADWRNLPMEKWNTTTVHAYLIERNEDAYGVEYVPFGKGSVGQRWSAEKGQIKTELTKKGAEAVKVFIDLCFDSHRYNPEYPCLSWGFMYAFKRELLAKAQAEVKKREEYEAQAKQSDVTEIDDDWF